MCGEVVGGEARKEGRVTPCGFSPEGTGEPRKDLERGRVECLFGPISLAAAGGVRPESGAQGGGWVGGLGGRNGGRPGRAGGRGQRI